MASVVLCLDEPNVQAILPRCQAARDHATARRARPICDLRCEAQGLSSEFSAEISRRGSGTFSRCRRRREFTMSATLPRRQRWRLVLNVPADLIREGLAHFLRCRPQIRNQRRIFRCHADRRLRPSPRRNSRHARSGARLWLQAPAGALPAAPLHAHAASLGRFPRVLQPGRRSGDLTDIYAAGEPPAEGITGEKLLARQSARPVTRTSSTRARCRAASNIMLREARPGTPCSRSAPAAWGA